MASTKSPYTFLFLTPPLFFLSAAQTSLLSQPQAPRVTKRQHWKKSVITELKPRPSKYAVWVTGSEARPASHHSLLEVQHAKAGFLINVHGPWSPHPKP